MGLGTYKVPGGTGKFEKIKRHGDKDFKNYQYEIRKMEQFRKKG